MQSIDDFVNQPSGGMFENPVAQVLRGMWCDELAWENLRVTKRMVQTTLNIIASIDVILDKVHYLSEGV